MEVDRSFEEFKETWLEDIIENNPTTVEKGRRFARKLMQHWLDFNDDGGDEIIFCDGSGDGGIDVAYFQKDDPTENNTDEGDRWYLVQSKYGSAFAGTETLLIEAQKVINTLDGKNSRLSSLTTDLIERLQNFRKNASIERDKLVLVFATVDPLSADERTALQDIKNAGVGRIGPLFDVAQVSLQTIYNKLNQETLQQAKVKVPIIANLVQSGSDLLVGSVKLINLYDFLKGYQKVTDDLDLIYEKNVRKFLGSRKLVNKGIAGTIQKEPERFGLYNNGITIVVEEFKIIETDRYELTEPYVVNGCQTTRVIWDELRKRIDSGGTGVGEEQQAYIERLKKGILVVKIVKVGEGDDELLTRTTEYTNSQNSVSRKDFIALQKGFRYWANEMEKEYNVFLEIQRGGWDSAKAKNRTRLDDKHYKDWVNAFDLLKVYGAAWLYEPGLAYGKNPPFAPGGSIFKKIVESDSFGVADLYACYLLLKLTKKLNFGRGTSEPKRGQTRYLFCFATMNLLKDVMTYSGIDTSPSGLTKAIIAVLSDFDSEAAQNLSSSAVQIIDDYMTKEMEDSIYSEPKNLGDSNAFLKGDKIGKSDDYSPKLMTLIALQKHLLRRPMGKSPAMSKAIVDSIKEAAVE